MTPEPKKTFSEAEIEAMIDRAVKKALSDLGLDNENAARDIRELRSWLDAVRAARHTFWQTFVRLLATGTVLCLIAGIVFKLDTRKNLDSVCHDGMVFALCTDIADHWGVCRMNCG